MVLCFFFLELLKTVCKHHVNASCHYRHTSLFCASLSCVFYTLKVHSNSALSKSIDTIFPIIPDDS